MTHKRLRPKLDAHSDDCAHQFVQQLGSGSPFSHVVDMAKVRPSPDTWWSNWRKTLSRTSSLQLLKVRLFIHDSHDKVFHDRISIVIGHEEIRSSCLPQVLQRARRQDPLIENGEGMWSFAFGPNLRGSERFQLARPRPDGFFRVRAGRDLHGPVVLSRRTCCLAVHLRCNTIHPECLHTCRQQAGQRRELQWAAQSRQICATCISLNWTVRCRMLQVQLTQLKYPRGSPWHYLPLNLGGLPLYKAFWDGTPQGVRWVPHFILKSGLPDCRVKILLDFDVSLCCDLSWLMKKRIKHKMLQK